SKGPISNVELTEYEGAQHVFDGVQFKVPLKLPDAQTTRNCRLEEIADGIVVNSQTKGATASCQPCAAARRTSGSAVGIHNRQLCRGKCGLETGAKTALRDFTLTPPPQTATAQQQRQQARQPGADDWPRHRHGGRAKARVYECPAD